ncbi:MAG TPA: AAA family ATPase [Vicinamibacterales bacterium]|nr:AAA family ATPase [Vicinamibacterales bacterium]
MNNRLRGGRSSAVAAIQEPNHDRWDEPPAAPATSEPVVFPSSWRLLDDVELMDLNDPEFLIDGVIPLQGVGVVYGPSASGKTTLLAGMTVAQATGREWFGHSIRHRGATVYAAAEDVSGFKQRLRAAKRAAQLPLDQPIGVYTFPESINMLDAVSFHRFRAFLAQVEYCAPLRQIVIDTYAAVTPGAAENSSEDTTTAMVHAQHLRDALGVTVVLVHHTNAGGTRERGHTSMRGAADFMISVTPVDDAIHVECSKQRNAAPFDKMTLKLIPAAGGEGCVMRLAADVLPSTELTLAQAKVYAVLRDSFTEDGASKSEWQRSCPDVPERTFHRACKVLIESGHVKTVGSHFRAVPR